VLITATKPFDDLWEQIKEALRAEARRHEGDADYVLRKLGGEFDIAVGKLCDFMIPINATLDHLMNFEERRKTEQGYHQLKEINKKEWKRAKKEREKVTEGERREDRLKRWTTMTNLALDRLNTNTLGTTSASDEEKRLDRIPYVSVIWAVHNRLLNHRKDLKWTKDSRYQELRDHIEKWVRNTSLY
jgi:hypothetical protein